jgi:lauroyl/myristoyl acyltransferase
LRERVLDRTVYWLFRLTILVMRPLPLRAGYWVAGNVAMVCYWILFPRHRRALKANLARVLRASRADGVGGASPAPTAGDPRQIEAMARRSFRNFGKYVVDFIHFPAMSRDEVRRRLRFDQYDELNAAAGSGRGVLIVTLHFGNWDLGAAALAAHDYPVHAIAETFRYGPMNDLVQGSRARLGMHVIGRERVGPAVFRALRRGEMLAMLIDIADKDAGTVEAEFFGEPAVVSSAPARLALRTGAWVVPSIVLRGPRDDLDIRPIIDTSLGDYAPSGDEAADVRDLTRLILASLEKPIAAHPDQWFIFRPLWRNAQAAATAPAHAGVAR